MTIENAIKLNVELVEAKNELDYSRRIGGFRYKQAKAHYERLLRRR